MGKEDQCVAAGLCNCCLVIHGDSKVAKLMSNEW